MPSDRASIGQDAPGAVVVGVDGTEGSLAALRWAVAEAAAHRAPLRIVHVLEHRAHRRATYARPCLDATVLRDRAAEAEGLISRAIVETRAPADVRRVFEIGNPAEALIRASRESRMLVLGHTPGRLRGPDELYQGPALGSVARACVTHAGCPVVVVPAAERGQDTLVPQGSPTDVTVVPQPVEGVRTLYPRYRATPVHR